MTAHSEDPRDKELRRLRARVAELEATNRALVDQEVDAWLGEADQAPVLLAEAQSALRRSETLFRAVFDSALDGLLIADDEGRYVDANPAACELYGVERKALVGRHVADFAAPGYDTAGEWEAFQSSGLREGTFPIVRPDGKQRLVEYRAIAGILPGRHLSALRDITEQDRAERRITELSELLRGIVDNAPVAIEVTDSRGEVQVWNATAEHLFGWEVGEVAGRPSPLDVQPTVDVADTDADGTGSQTRVEIRRRDGTPIRVRCYWAEVDARPGHAGMRVAVYADLTREDRLQHQLAQSQKMEAVGRLAGGIAHDFNNLLTVIEGHTSLLLDDPRVAPDHREEVLAARDAAMRAADLTRRLLLFSKQQVAQLRSLDLRAVILGMEPLLRRTLGENVRLSLDLKADGDTVRADRSMLEQVLLNLVVNARDAMPEGGTITVGTRGLEAIGDGDEQRQIALRVTDTGVGMSPEVIDRLFEPFYTTKGTGGSGLGLSTTYGIVEQLGGSIHVASAVGKGSTFEIRLPLEAAGDDVGPEGRAAATVGPAHPPSPEPGPVGTGLPRATILVVEDEDGVRRLARRILERGGYRVLEAASGQEALAMVDPVTTRIDLLFTDVVMPNMDGRRLAETLREQLGPDLPVLFTSGYAAEDTSLQRIDADDVDLLEKPYTPNNLLDRIEEILGRAGSA